MSLSATGLEADVWAYLSLFLKFSFFFFFRPNPAVGLLNVFPGQHSISLLNFLTPSPLNHPLTLCLVLYNLLLRQSIYTSLFLPDTSKEDPGVMDLSLGLLSCFPANISDVHPPRSIPFFLLFRFAFSFGLHQSEQSLSLLCFFT